MHQRGEQGPEGRRWDRCGECGHRDATVRDLGLRVRYGLCDPCFTDLVAARTLSGPLPLSRILDDLPGGELSGAAAEPGRAAGELSGTADELDGEPDAPRPPRPPRARRSAEP